MNSIEKGSIASVSVYIAEGRHTTGTRALVDSSRVMEVIECLLRVMLLKQAEIEG